MSEDEKIRLLLVDDEVRVRQGLRMRLEVEPDLMVVGEAGDGRSAAAAAATLHPDVVVMDLVMPQMDGLMSAAQVSEALPGVKIVILTIHDDRAMRERVGATGLPLVTKEADVSLLLSEIRRIAGDG